MSLFGELFEDEDESAVGLADLFADVPNSAAATNAQAHGRAGARRRKLLKQLLKGDGPVQRRGDAGFVGLSNQGATCYLNSLVQMIYMTPEMRAAMYALRSDDFPNYTPPMPGQDDECARAHESACDGSGSVSAPVPEPVDRSVLRDDVSAAMLTMGLAEEQVLRARARFPTTSNVEKLIGWIFENPDEAQAAPAMAAHAAAADDKAQVIAREARRINRIAEAKAKSGASGGGTATGAVTQPYDTESMDTWMDMLGGESVAAADDSELDGADNRAVAEQVQEDGAAVQDLGQCSAEASSTAKQIAAAMADQQDVPLASAAAASTTAAPRAAASKKRRLVPIPLELQRLFAKLQLADQRAITTDALTRAFGWDGREGLQQHDIHELNRILFDVLERSLKKSPRPEIQKLIPSLYRGELVNKIICLNCNSTRERTEAFMDLPVFLEGHARLTDSLMSWCSFELMDGANKVECDACGGTKQDALKGISCRTPPPILTLCLARFTYDYRKDKRIKLSNSFAFPLVLDVEPYTEDAVIARTEAAMMTGEPLALALARVAAAAAEGPVTAAGPNSDGRGKGKGKGKAGAQHSRAEGFAELFRGADHAGNSKYLYDLVGVLIHIGGAFGGHYHALFRDVLGEGVRAPAIPSGAEDQATATESTAEDGAGDRAAVGADTVDASASDASAAASSTLGQRASARQSAREERRRRQEQQYGAWFDFNDSSVTPVSLEALLQQYGGKSECAYMLVYRQRNSPALTPTDAVSVPRVPDPLAQEIAQLNEYAVEDRQVYDEVMHQIEFVVHRPAAFAWDSSDVLRPVAQPLRSSAGVSDALQTCATFHVDERGTIGDLRSAIATEFVHDWVSEHQWEAMGRPSWPLPSSRMMLHFVVQQGGRTLLRRLCDDGSYTDATKLAAMGVTEGVTMLAWDGESIDGRNYAATLAPITIHVVYYRNSARDVDRIELSISEGATMQQLRSLVDAWTEMDLDDQLLFLTASGDDTLRFLSGPGHRRTEDRPLHQLGLYDGSSITVEAWPKHATAPPDPPVPSPAPADASVASAAVMEAGSYARAAWAARQNSLNLHVFDTTRNAPEAYSFLVERTVSLHEFKREILAHPAIASASLNLVNCILRRTQRGDAPGAAFGDEAMSLHAHGLRDHDRVLLERGEATPPTDGVMNVRVVHGSPDGVRISDTASCAVSRYQSVAEAKVGVCATLGRDASASRMRVCDLFDAPGPLLTDEAMLLDSIGVREGDTLWIEDGAPPAPGQISVAVLHAVAQPENPAAAAVTSDMSQLKEIYLSPVDSVSMIGDVQVTLSDTLQQLKTTMCSQLPALQGTPPMQLRVWKDGRIVRDTRSGTMTLKQRHFSHGCAVTVQKLPEGDPAAMSGTVLYVRRRLVDLLSYEPAREVVIQGTATREAVLAAACAAAGVPQEHASVAKYFVGEHAWKPLPPPAADGTAEAESAVAVENTAPFVPANGVSDLPAAANGPTASAATALSRKRKAAPRRRSAKSLKGKPFHLRDGDVLGVRDDREDPRGRDDWRTLHDHLLISRVHKWSASRRAERLARRGVEWEDSVGRSGPRRAEPQLKIMSYDDYLSDEDDGAAAADDDGAVAAGG